MCDTTAGQVIVTYHLSERGKIENLLERARDLRCREIWQLRRFLEKAGVNIKVVDNRFPFTSSLVEVPKGEEIYAISRLFSLAEPGSLLAIEPNIRFSPSAAGLPTQFS